MVQPTILTDLRQRTVDTASPLARIRQIKLEDQQLARQAELDKQNQIDRDLARQATKQQMRQQQLQNIDAESASILLGAAKLHDILEAGDEKTSLFYLKNRRDNLKKLGIDTSDTQEAIDIIQSGTPEQKQELMTQLANAKDAATKLGMLGGGGVKFAPIFDDNGNVVAQRNLVTGEVKSDPRAPKSPNTVVNVNPETGDKITVGQKAEIDAIDQKIRSVFKYEDGIEAQMSKTEDLINRVKSGSGTGGFAEVKILLSELGVPVEDATDLSAIRSMSIETIIPELKQAGTNPTDFDFKQIMKAHANVGKEPEANLILLDAKKQMQERVKSHAEIIRQANRLAQEKGIDSQTSAFAIDAALREYDRNNPLRLLSSDEAREMIKQNKKQDEGGIVFEGFE